MPITLAHLKRNTRTLAVEFAGETVTCTYSPGEITPSLGLELADEGLQLPVVHALQRLLKSWDVLDDDSMLPVPVAEDVLQSLPTEFLNAVLRAIMQDVAVGKTNGATSAAG